jgi:lipoic acid synthetase
LSRSPEKPPWLKVRAPTDPEFARVRELIRERGVNTVCTASRCPNMGECWSGGNATFMILGRTCTRSCGFCAVAFGDPGEEVDQSEAEAIADIVEEIGLDHAVITSVTRDDLADGGASHFASVVKAIRRRNRETTVELLIPDFGGNETVRRLQGQVRDTRASYALSLSVLRRIGEIDETVLTKSSLMVGLGEMEEEVIEAMEDLLEAGVDFLNIGQYLQPKGGRLPISEFIHPEQFQSYRETALDLGFRFVAAGPFVRSSYKAKEALVSV